MKKDEILSEVRENRKTVKSFVAKNWVWFGVGLGVLIAVMAVFGTS
jgi:hypothetical protein